ncbi:transmembrane protein 18-domain-containing protein [Cokeromyces recurvatus]|uniref:transmembrane protein 18-domain-containing protein n=1 Tax=Cokeromyces recurvatus TaxID=90255 RepID=UPI00221EFEBE|nr:transmembrane protein 18-domain-containing protein [Cokeromyces recurvatus]KAI7899440.1 transmembrane protein 18-domain-containing protein [Cokeromyces recurvatus]
MSNNEDYLSNLLLAIQSELLGLATLTKPLNDFGIKHWQSFSKDPYFNTSGLFIVSVYSFPIILNSLITLMWILKAIVSLFVQTKKLQLKQKIDRQRQKKKK